MVIELQYTRHVNNLWDTTFITLTSMMSVSNHQPHGCLLNCLFRRRSKKTSKFRVTGLCVGNSPGPVNSPYKGPVTRKMFPFDDVIMSQNKVCEQQAYRDGQVITAYRIVYGVITYPYPGAHSLNIFCYGMSVFVRKISNVISVCSWQRGEISQQKFFLEMYSVWYPYAVHSYGYRRIAAIYTYNSVVLKHHFQKTIGHVTPYRARYLKRSTLVQVMDCRKFSTNPLPEPMLNFCQLDTKEHISKKFYLNSKSFNSRKWS